MKVILVAAVARDGVIGRDGSVPWHLPEDMAHFRELTLGHPVVMGRKTWDSVPERFRPLPGRRNVVVTRNHEWSAEGAERAGSLDEALRLLGGEPVAYVIGGAELYAAALPLADELELTEIDAEFAGDAWFPSWPQDEFEETSREMHLSAEGTRFAFITYRRTAASRQLAALRDVDRLLAATRLEYWLFGGWAVDFYVGRITRPHSDVDIAVWLDDVPRIIDLLTDHGWRHAPYPDEDGGTGYERDDIRLELTYLMRRDDGHVVIPLREREATWPKGAFGSDCRELEGVRARLVSLDALASGKSAPRDDQDDALKDRADFELLSRL